MLRGTLIALFLILASCTSGDSQRTESGTQILVSIAPQKYFVESIAGDLARVTVLIPPGASPAAYEMSPSDMRIVSEAEIWFSIGVPAEMEWAADFPVMNPDLVIVNTVESIERLPVERSAEHHEHNHGDIDPHVWLSPELVKVQVLSISAALISSDPDNGAAYRRNTEELLNEIELLQVEMHRLLDPCSGGSFLVFHPSWGYLADEFNLEQIPVETAGSEPSPGEMAHLLELAGERGISTVFVSPQFSMNAAETIADEINGEVVVMDPLAVDWSGNMLLVAAAVAEAMN